MVRWIWLAALFGLLGCGPGGGGAPVGGVVTLDGQPLSGAKVSLTRGDGPKEQRFYLGETNNEGRYEMRSAATQAPGVAPGEYQLRITSVQAPVDATETTQLPPERLPPMYQSGKLTMSVDEAGNPNADFAISTRRR